MWVRTEAFHVPKHGNSASEYEDAYFPQERIDRELTEFRCAVADGASESAFAGLWARLLVRSFGRRRMRLQRLRRLWARAVGTGPRPWYVQTKLRFGSHAAFVGLCLRDAARGEDAAEEAEAEPADEAVEDKQWLILPGAKTPDADDGGNDEAGGPWRAIAVGDSCLFQVRDGQMLVAGPVCRSDQFGNTPFLLSTKSREPIRAKADHVSVLSGRWQPRDTFYLATDALAQWLLAEHEADRPPWPTLGSLGGDGESSGFERLVEEQRVGGSLHNDDTTLLCLEVD